MNESIFGEYFCDDYLCTCLDKDVPYCIICGVYIRENISSLTLLCFWSSCFFIDVILLIGRRKHTITSAPLLFFISLLKESGV